MRDYEELLMEIMDESDDIEDDEDRKRFKSDD